MPLYVIKRIDDDKYVARPGSRHSYTARIQDAQVFRDHKEAQRHRCGNEVITTVQDELHNLPR